MKPIETTFRIIHFPKPNLYIGVAWNYDEAVLISTYSCVNRDAARTALQADADKRGVKLRWFDGDYECDHKSGLLVAGAWS